MRSPSQSAFATQSASALIPSATRSRITAASLGVGSPKAPLRDRRYTGCPADVAQLVEHFTRNEGVPGSSPGVGLVEPGEIRHTGRPSSRRLSDRPPGEAGATVARLKGGRSRLRALLVVPALLAVACAAASSAHAGSGFFFGFSDDGPKWGGAVEPGRAVGASAFRITLNWVPGESDLTPQDVTDVANAVAATSGLRLVLAVYGSAASTPQDDPSRTEFCSYAKNAVVRFPSINDVVIWNEPNLSAFWRPQFNPDDSSAAPAAYEALLARCWDVLHAYRPGINVVGPATSPRGNDNPHAVSNISHSPVRFIERMGLAYRASGRTEP